MRPPPQSLSHHSALAFTLVELLCGIAVAVTLAMTVFYAASQVSLLSRDASCVSNMRQLYIALMAYRGEHSGYLPPGEFVSYDDKGTFNWQNYLRPDYLAAPIYCPSMRLSEQGKSEFPDQKGQFQRLAGYSVNYYFLRTKVDGLPGKWWGSPPLPDVSRFVFIAETYGSGATWSTEHIDLALSGPDWPTIRLAPRNHGKETLNWCFLDGHIRKLARPITSNGSPDWRKLFDPKGNDGKYIGPRAIPQSLDHPGI